jgi:hypothetical protein
MKPSTNEEIPLSKSVAWRSVLKGLAMAAGATTLRVSAAHADTYPKLTPAAKDAVFADSTRPVVETDLGKGSLIAAALRLAMPSNIACTAQVPLALPLLSLRRVSESGERRPPFGLQAKASALKEEPSLGFILAF